MCISFNSYSKMIIELQGKDQYEQNSWPVRAFKAALDAPP